MPYVNELTLAPISTNEIVPITITFEELDDVTTNAIVSVTRYNSAGTGTAITTNASISGNVVSLTDIWVLADTRTAGEYRIRVIARNSTTTIKCEANLIIEVL